MAVQGSARGSAGGARGSKWLGVLRTPVGAGAGLLLFAVIVMAVIAPWVWGHDASVVDTDAINSGPVAGHPMGTDGLGRDIFYRVLVASRLSVELALAATAIGVVAGTLLGTAPAVLPRWAGRFVVAVVNIAVAFPGLLLALFFAVIFGVGTEGAVLAIGFAFAPAFARLTQTMSAGVAGKDFIAAARVAGVGRVRMLTRHVLPNIGEPLVVQATIGAGQALLAFAGLSFLGIGVQAPDYDWGRLLGEGLSRIYINPAAALAPGVAVVVAGLAFNLFGEAAAAVVGVRTAHTRPGSAPVPAGRVDVLDERAGQPVLVVDNLQVSFPGPGGWVTPVRGVSFAVGAGQAVGVVGESGSGKSLTALAVAQLIEHPGSVAADRLEFAGTPLLHAAPRAVRSLLGTSLAMVFQDPTSSFNPAQRIGRQLAEVARQHQGLSRRAAFDRAVDRLRAVRVPAPERRARQYPHEFSGGMRQRAMIGMGLMATPRMVIADEPTTALDVTVQRQVLRLLARVRADTDAAILLISHDIAVVAQTCDRILVMYAGRIVEDLPTRGLSTGHATTGHGTTDPGAVPQHPYTRALLAVVPDLATDRDAPLPVIDGRPPAPAQVGAGCAFAPRCAFATDKCRTDDPALEHAGPHHRVACWHPVTDTPADAATTAANLEKSGVNP